MIWAYFDGIFTGIGAALLLLGWNLHPGLNVVLIALCNCVSLILRHCAVKESK
jgi:hypothetical protein